MTDTTASDRAGTEGESEPSAREHEESLSSHEREEPLSSHEREESPPGGERKDPLPGGEHPGSTQTGRPEQLDTPERIDWGGWLLVALVVLSFVVVPLFVLYIPEAHWLIGRLGFSQRQAYIVFPMLPAILLGITAVWATMRAYTE